jgi:hypothetical protein
MEKLLNTLACTETSGAALEIVITEASSFPVSPNHPKRTTEWTLMGDLLGQPSGLAEAKKQERTFVF